MNFTPHYENSRALIIGINNYKNVSPLGFAISDAEAISKILQEKFSFPEANIDVLLDDNAPRIKIMETYLSYVTGEVNPDDRIIVFFAGHGYTLSGSRKWD